MNSPKSNKKLVDNFIKYSSLGFEMMAIIAAGTWGGYKIDQLMGNKFKVFTLGLMVVSVIISVLYGVRNLLKK
jgi:hypothetical protein